LIKLPACLIISYTSYHIICCVPSRDYSLAAAAANDDDDDDAVSAEVSFATGEQLIVLANVVRCG